MIAAVKYHYRILRLPDDMTLNEVIQRYAEITYFKVEEAKNNPFGLMT